MADDDGREEIRFGPEIAPGTRVAIRRDAKGEERVVSVCKGDDGKPLLPNTEVASVSAHSEDGWHEVQTLYRNGPAQVATPAYREGYDRIFGKKPAVGEA